AFTSVATRPMMPVVFPFFPPFFPFEPLSSAISVSFFWLLAHPAKRADQTSSEFKSDLCRQKRSRIIEGAWLTLRPLIKSRGVHDDFAVRSQLHEGAVHGPGRRTLEIYPFVIVAASMARTFELVFAGLPVRRTAQMSTTSVDDKNAIRSAIYPDAILLLPFRVHAQTVIGGIPDLENGGWFEKSAGQKKTEKSQKPCRQKSGDRHPHQPAAALVNLIVLGTNRGYTG